jgi:hypothetical protein
LGGDGSFPFGQNGDICFDLGQQELVMIEACEAQEHKHTGSITSKFACRAG